MSRQVLLAAVTIPATDYAHPARVHKKGDVVELSAAEITAIGAGNLRAASTTNVHDQLGEAFAVSNSSA